MPSAFQFKQFHIEQRRGVHPVGTDGVLLGAWAEVGAARRILDIGAGTGLVALMLAQRTAFLQPQPTIWAVEAQPEASANAALNFSASPWSDRLVSVGQRIQDFAQTTSGQFDLIVSNPPFFPPTTLSPEATRQLHRSALALPMHDLLNVLQKLLTENGRFCAILPPEEAQRLVEWGSVQGLYCTRLTAVYSRSGKPVERVLIQLERNPYQFERSRLVIQDLPGEYSEAFRNLTKAFYLFF